MDEPGVEIGLQRLDGFVEVVAHGDPEELVEDGAVEALDEAARHCPRTDGGQWLAPWGADPGAAVFNAVEVEIEFVGMAFGAAELPAVVGEHCADRKVELAVEGQHVVVQDRNSRLGLLGDVEKAESVRAEGVDDGVQIDPADPLETADEEGVG